MHQNIEALPEIIGHIQDFASRRFEDVISIGSLEVIPAICGNHSNRISPTPGTFELVEETLQKANIAGTWQLKVAGLKNTCPSHPFVKVTNIVPSGIELKVKAPDSEKIRICYLYSSVPAFHHLAFVALKKALQENGNYVPTPYPLLTAIMIASKSPFQPNEVAKYLKRIFTNSSRVTGEKLRSGVAPLYNNACRQRPIPNGEAVLILLEALYEYNYLIADETHIVHIPSDEILPTTLHPLAQAELVVVYSRIPKKSIVGNSKDPRLSKLESKIRELQKELKSRKEKVRKASDHEKRIRDLDVKVSDEKRRLDILKFDLESRTEDKINGELNQAIKEIEDYR